MTCPKEPLPLARCAPGICCDRGLSWPFLGSNVMRSIHGVGELMTQVVLRGGGFLPMTPTATAPEGNVKQAEPEKEDIMVMDTKLKIIEILQVTMGPKLGAGAHFTGENLCAVSLLWWSPQLSGREWRQILSLGCHFWTGPLTASAVISCPSPTCPVLPATPDFQQFPLLSLCVGLCCQPYFSFAQNSLTLCP